LAFADTASTIRVVRFTETLFLRLEVKERFFISRFDIDWAVVAGSQKLENTYNCKDDHDRLECTFVGSVKFHL